MSQGILGLSGLCFCSEGPMFESRPEPDQFTKCLPAIVTCSCSVVIKERGSGVYRERRFMEGGSEGRQCADSVLVKRQRAGIVR